MDDQVIPLLAATQSSAAAPRQQAEASLEQLYANPSFPISLASIASHTSVDLSVRQSALFVLKNYVLASWHPEFDEFKGQVLLDDESKSRLRSILLELATSDGVDRRVQLAASYVVSKIAGADFPEEWPDLLHTLLNLVHSSPSDARLHGALKVLAELVSDGLDEAQFFRIARDLVKVLHTVAADGSRRAKLRALAVSVLKEGFNTLQVLQEDHKVEVAAFAEESLGEWMVLFLEIINAPLDAPPVGGDDSENDPLEVIRGLVALKIQVIRVLITLRLQFPKVISPKSPIFFHAVWHELTRFLQTYQNTYIDNDAEGRLEDQDGLAYTIDFLVLEDLDFMHGCIRAPPVQKELEGRLQAGGGPSNWIKDLMILTISYAQITVEEQGMWDIDVNVFLAEETGVTASYNARAASSDLVVKVGEWQQQKLVEGLLACVQELYSRAAPTSDDKDWRLREASLYVLGQVLVDWEDFDRKLDPQMSNALITFARSAQQSPLPLLRARGFTVAATIMKASGGTLRDLAESLMQRNITAIQTDPSEIVQASCVRAIQAYLSALPIDTTLFLQTRIIQVLREWFASKELGDLTESEELLFTLTESLRDLLLLDTRICASGDGLNLLFSIVSRGSDNFQMTNLVAETFEEICSTIAPLGGEAYIQLCQKALPSLTGAFDVGSMTEENSLTSLAAELLTALSSHAPSPLPPGFVDAVLPKIVPILLNHTDDELLKSCTTSLKNILDHDPEQLLSYTSTVTADPKSGLELVLAVIDRLLSPSVDDNAAADVGGLAATLVEKAGAERLGPYLMPLLRAVAIRVGTATKVDLIQSLILVFGRLAAHNAKDVVEFLSQVEVPPQSQSRPGSAPSTPTSPHPSHTTTNGLSVVMPPWLEHTPTFAGHSAITINITALAHLYSLGDPRLAAITVKGDLIIPSSDRVVTRSRAKANPDRFTTVSVPVKILKLLVDELLQSSAAANANPALGVGVDAGPNGHGHSRGSSKGGDGGDEIEDDDEEDGEWEDDDTLAAFGGAASAAALQAFAEEEPRSAGRAGGQADAETAVFLADFFKQQAHLENFKADYEYLGGGEKEVLGSLT